MRRSKLFPYVFVIAAIACTAGWADLSHAQADLIDRGAVWKYLDDGSDQGIAWRDLGFNDAGWAEGPAELGYGEGDEATVVSFGADPSNKYITTYFRHSFTEADPGQYPALQLEVLYDDGAVAFLNGLEVARFNMPGVPGLNDFDFRTLASQTNEETWSAAPIDPGLLLTGTNVVAVEIHQASANSSDISFDLRLRTGPQAFLRKGPYLIYPGVSTQMQILWQLEDDQRCLLEWGLDTACSDGSVQTNEFGGDHQHQYVINNLIPGRKYFYRVTDEHNTACTGSFLTAPLDSATRVKFIGYGDTRTYAANHDRVCEAMAREYQTDPELQTFLLQDGDWTEFDDEWGWANEFFNITSENARRVQSEMPIQGSQGNHETWGNCYSKYWPYPYVNDYYWSFDYGPVHVAVVDCYADYSPGSAQHDWLENDLANSSKCWKILLLHEPGWSAGGHGNNAGVQDFLHPLCVTHGVSIVFAGHNHYYARAEVDGVQHITSGGGGAGVIGCDPGYPNILTCDSAHHFCIFDIDDDTLNFTAKDEYGNVLDTFTLTCSADMDFESYDIAADVCSLGGPGDGNGTVDPGETVTLDITLTNPGNERATNVQATLYSMTPGVTITPGQETATYPNFNPGQSRRGDTPFAFSTDTALVGCDDTLEFQLDITYTTALGTRTETAEFAIEIPDPCHVCSPPAVQLELESVTLLNDSCALGGGDGNGEVEPGEHAVVRVRLRNDGASDATGITGTLSSAAAAVTQGTAALALLAAGSQADLAPGFEFDVDLSTPCGTILDFTLDLAYNEGSDTTNFSIAIPDPCTACDVPHLSVDTVALVGDSCDLGGPGDGNGAAEPGEHVVVRVILGNGGPIGATGITATLSSTDVTVTQGSGSLAALPAFSQGDLAPDFEFDIDLSTPCGTILDFTLDLAYNEGSDTTNFSIPIPDPCEACPETGCKLGQPDRITDFKLARMGADVGFNWTPDPKAEGGYHFYNIDVRQDIPNLRLENPPPIPDPFLSAGPAEPMPFVYSNAIQDGLLYYQILGVCTDGMTEGPN